MSYLESIILGIVEGLTEFLPISSTAHLDLSRQLLNLPATDFIKSFEIAIQLGAILAVVFLYWNKVFNKDFKQNFLKLLTAFLPTAFLGLIFYSIIKNYLLGNNLIMALALLIGGLVLIVFEIFYKEPLDSRANSSLKEISYSQAAIIGLFQSIAMIPGVSRAAATIIGGLAIGIKRSVIVEFSFLLAIPTMLAATSLDLYKSGAAFSAAEYGLLAAGFVAAFFTAMAAVKFFLKYIKKHDFKAFGFYRVIIGLLVLWLML